MFEKVNQLCKKCDILEREAGVILPTLSNAAAAGDILTNKQAVDGSGNLIVGTMAAGVVLPTLTNAATAGDILTNKQAVDGSGNLIVGTMAAGVTLPTLTNAAAAGDILSGKQAVDGSGNLIYGSHVCATLESMTADADAVAADIVNGKTAYVKGLKVIGTKVVPLTPSSMTVTCRYQGTGVLKNVLKTTTSSAVASSITIGINGTFYSVQDEAYNYGYITRLNY